MERTTTLLVTATIASTLVAQQWLPVVGAPSGLSVCQTLSADTCRFARSMSDYFVTNDGGASFDSANTQFTTEWCTDMHFPTDQVGYACGGSHYGTYKNVITKTVDGGATWFPLTSDEFPGFSFGRIQFVTEDIGFVSGDWANFLKTVDGGTTFTSIDLQLPGSNSVLDIHFDGTIGYVCTRTRPAQVGDNDDIYRILKSTDLGDTWTVLYTDTVLDRTYTTDRGVNGVRFIGPFGLACGNNGLVWRTTDGGNNWTETTVLSDTTFFFDLEMVSEQTAFIVTAYAYAGGYRNTLQTSDGGITWTALPHQFKSVSVKGVTGYAIDGAGQLYKNANVLLGLNEQEAHTLTLFPNPATGDVTVQLPRTTTAGVCSLIDTGGRVVIEQRFAAGGSITLTVGVLSSGVYTVRISDTDRGRIHQGRLVIP